MAPSPDVRIVPAGPERWLEIVRIEARCFAHPWDPLTLHRVLESPGCRSLGAEAGGRLVGHVVWAVEGRVCHLMDLAVLPEWRRQGVGRRLVEEVLEDARRSGAPFVFLEVRPSNPGALAFYREIGFDPIGRRPGYYTDTGEDAVVLAMDLEP